MPPRNPLLRSVGFTLTAMALGLPLAAAIAWAARGGPAWAAPLATVLYMFTPLLAAAVWNRRDGKGLTHRIRPHRGHGWAWIAAWAVPVAVTLATLLATLAWPGVTFDAGFGGLLSQLDPTTRAAVEPQLAQLPPLPVLLPMMLVQGLVAGTTLNAVAAYGEEAGWRGWMHDELAGQGFWPRAAWTGVLWGLWHAPLILQGHNYPDHPVAGVVLMVAMCVGLSGPMAELRERTGTVLSAAVFHGVFNAVASLPILFAVGGSDLTSGVTGAAGIGVLVLLNLALAVWRRQKASSSSSSDHEAPIDTTATRNATSS